MTTRARSAATSSRSTTSRRTRFVDGKYIGNTGTRRWIGLSDQAVENNFVWDSGEPVTYTAWGPGEPNNSATRTTSR